MIMMNRCLMIKQGKEETQQPTGMEVDSEKKEGRSREVNFTNTDSTLPVFKIEP